MISGSWDITGHFFLFILLIDRFLFHDIVFFDPSLFFTRVDNYLPCGWTHLFLISDSSALLSLLVDNTVP